MGRGCMPQQLGQDQAVTLHYKLQLSQPHYDPAITADSTVLLYPALATALYTFMIYMQN